MAPAQMYTPCNDSAPLLRQLSDEDRAASGGSARAGQRPYSRCHVITMVSVLGAGCALAGVTVLQPSASASRTVDAIEYASVSTAGTHEVVSKSTGKCLNWGDVIISLRECDSTNPKERWTYKDDRFQTPDGRCLDMGGESVHIWNCDTIPKDAVASNQRWKFDEQTAQLVPVAGDGACLIPGPDGTGVSLEPCDANRRGQKWHVRAHANDPSKQSAEPQASKSGHTADHAAADASKAPELQSAGGSGGASRAIITSILAGCLLLLALGMGALFLWKKQHTEEDQTRALKMKEADLEAAKEVEQPEQQPKRVEQPEEEAAPLEGDVEQVDPGTGGSPFEEAAAQEQEAGPSAQDGELLDAPPLQEAAHAEPAEAPPSAVEAAAEGAEAAAEAEASAAPGEPAEGEVVPAAEVATNGAEEAALAAGEAAPAAGEAAPQAAEAVPAAEEAVPAAEEAAPAAGEAAPQAAEAVPAAEEAVPAAEEAAPSADVLVPAAEAAAVEAPPATGEEALQEPQEQQPLMEEPQEPQAQAAPQAELQQANQAATAPKKKGKGCVVS